MYNCFSRFFARPLKSYFLQQRITLSREVGGPTKTIENSFKKDEKVSSFLINATIQYFAVRPLLDGQSKMIIMLF